MFSNCRLAESGLLRQKWKTMEKLGGRCLPHTTVRGREKYDKGRNGGGVLVVAEKIDLKKEAGLQLGTFLIEDMAKEQYGEVGQGIPVA